jgi:ubiquinone/menaquinone biosynthesis C-methylase UbiE
MSRKFDRSYKFFDQCVEELTQDVYAQPPDNGHTDWALETLDWLRTAIYDEKSIEGERVLDIGCGWGFMANPFMLHGFDWHGITIGADFNHARRWLKRSGLDPKRVTNQDMTFLSFGNQEFDLLFARHVLEHSPFPIITLMEWRRITKVGGYLCLVMPAPHWWQYGGRNHYSIVPQKAVRFWLGRAGWRPTHYFEFSNRETSFLKHLEVLNKGLAVVSPEEREATKKLILESYPEGPVEYRFICQRSEEEWSDERNAEEMAK